MFGIGFNAWNYTSVFGLGVSSVAPFYAGFSGIESLGFSGVGAGFGFNFGYDSYIGLGGLFNAFGMGTFSGFSAGLGYNLSHLRASYENLTMTPIYRDVIERRAVYKEVLEKKLVQQAEKRKMRDYFLEHTSNGVTRTHSPIILDLNGDGKFDVTDKDPRKEGRIDGRTVKFDIAPDEATWSYRSFYSGRAIYNKLTPEQRKELKEKGHITLKPNQFRRELGYRYRYAKENGEMELRWENGKPVVYYGKKQEKENVEWLKPGAKDGFLVWDVDGDGKITSSKELFGEYDIDGRKRFKNGYEKLAHYFDKNKDGVISGDELKGLKIWVDKDADGITDPGELRDLSEYNITKLNTKMTDPNKMESTFTVGKDVYKYERRKVLAGYEEIRRRELAGYQLDYTKISLDYAQIQPYYWFNAWAGAYAWDIWAVV